MAQMSFRINEKSKKEFEDLCEELGMTPTTALTIYIKKMCREKRIPFEVSLYSTDTLTAMKQVKNGQYLSQSFSSTEELLTDLDSED